MNQFILAMIGLLTPVALSQQPNIILLLSDDQAWDGTSVQMDPDIRESASSLVQTPNLERLAAQGMRLSSAYSPAPVCSPSRISIQTGKSPAQLHWTKAARPYTAADGYKLIPPANIKSIDTNEITVAELLKTAGYNTAHLGKWHIAGGGPGHHGYDVHDGDTGNQDAAAHVDPNPVDIMGMTERAKSFMTSNAKSETPFFLQMSYHALHYPENANKATIEKYRQLGARQKERQILRAAIAEDLDTGIGDLLAHLDELDLADNTYVIYMADNGSGGSSRVLRGGKGGLWEGGVRVPFIIRGPGIAPNSTNETVIVGSDFLPTFAHLAGIERELPDGVEGGDFMPALIEQEQEVERPRDFIAFHFPHYQGQDGPQSSILVGDLKLIRHYDRGDINLFDLSTDPGERRDLSSTRTEDARRLDRMLQSYLEDIGADLPRPNPRFDPTRIPVRDPKKRDRGRKRS